MPWQGMEATKAPEGFKDLKITNHNNQQSFEAVANQ